VSVPAFHLDVTAVAPPEDVGGSEKGALIAAEDGVVVAERLHERGCCFVD
jgi:hypothetical protein